VSCKFQLVSIMRGFSLIEVKFQRFDKAICDIRGLHITDQHRSIDRSETNRHNNVLFHLGMDAVDIGITVLVPV